ncbi:hypothetical protein, partial [Chitinophaga agrisoli]|uniref:hypothetical protein n=1 Tax=Chitinophaga agrisoli TaxID=2607653 RepID=UPI001BC91F49
AIWTNGKMVRDWKAYIQTTYGFLHFSGQNLTQITAKDLIPTVSCCSRLLEIADLDDKVTNFHRYVIKQRKKHGYALSQIGNMNEFANEFRYG